MRALFIVNPAAKRVRRAGAEALARALERAGLEVELRASTRPDEAAREALRLDVDGRAAAGGAGAGAGAGAGEGRARAFDRVVVAGGDGTVRSVVGALPPSDPPPLAVLPLGTSNSVARSLGLPLDVRKAIELAAGGRARAIDVGEVSGPRVAAQPTRGRARAESGGPVGRLPFLLCASAGVDAEVACRYESTRRGRSSFIRYAVVALRTALFHEHQPIDVDLDGIACARGVKVVVAANMRVYGGLFRFAPDARADDGLLDLLAIRGEGTVGLGSALVRAFFGLRQRPERALALQGGSTRWETPAGGDVPVQVDGEPAGHLPVEVTVRPGAVKIVLPG